jgi:Hydrazine synthase alpha subunit middle domain
VKQHMKSIALGAALAAVAGGVGCGSDDDGPLSSVDSLIILQRPKRNDVGDIFQYTSYKAGAKLIKLSPPTADGKREVICCDQFPGFENADISGYDISFDAKEIVFSAALSGGERYGLFVMNIANGTAPEQLPTDPGRHYISPVFLPGDRILFTTNGLEETGARQFQDEYERGETLQLGRINRDGSGEILGPRNLSHRTFPTLVSDGRVMFTQWDHLGPLNAGHLMFVNQDMRELREGFGKEGTGAANSTLKVREVSPGRYVAVATSRDRTVQAGALIDIRLGTVVTKDGVVSAPERTTEANATFKTLTPDVPRDRDPSPDRVGRYYDAFPLNAKDSPDLLVSWADGPVESGVLGAAGLSANFGIYLYDSARKFRLPILDDPEMWDIFPRPLQTRTAPPIVGSASDASLGDQALIGAMNVYESTMKDFDPGSIFGVRVIEGFSSEEGFPRMFGTSMFEGQASLGVAPVRADGSWLARVPANVPLAVQAIDKFGMALLPEPVWFSAGKGESRICGGCHEARDSSTVIDPGLTDAAAIGPTQMFGGTARAMRKSLDTDLTSPNVISTTAGAKAAGHEKLVGMAWNLAVQSVFDAKCLTCHDSNNAAGIAPYTITDPATGESVSWTFNLSSTKIPLMIGGEDLAGAWPASYFSIAGPDMEAIEEANLVVSSNFKVYASPQNSRDSLLIKKLNPTQLFPEPNPAVRAFTTAPHSQGKFTELTPTEFYKLILMADHGVNYYARENKPMNLQ